MSATIEQQRVVDAPLHGPHLVNAGAGTGKTFTLVERAVALVRAKTIRPDELLVVTFTNAAASEIADRLDAGFAPIGAAGRPTCGTFHGIAASLLREFAYVTGGSPDVRAVDDSRARGVFALTFRDLLAGKLHVDTSALPLLERTRELERSLATVALRLKNLGRSVDEFERDALAAADSLEALPFGAVEQRGQKNQILSGWPQPNPPLTAAQRAEEAERERGNVRTVAALFRRFDERLGAEQLLTFGDVLTRTTAMLHAHPEITETLRERWRHAMVDEFQDTNPVQIAFLRALFGDDLRCVLAVGDLRQAIYAFNGADPQGIIRFAELNGCTPYPLTVNRRSYQPILDLAHEALAIARAVPDKLHTQLSAHRGDTDHRAVRVQLFTGDDALQRESDAIARTARALVDAGTSPKQIAVLLRSRSKAQIYADALRRHGLAVQVHGGAGFFDAAEIRELVAWLRLVDAPDDAYSITAALQSAAIGISDGALATLAVSRDLARAALLGPLDEFTVAERTRIERFRTIVRVISTLADVPLADAVRTVISASGTEIARIDGDAGALDQARANLDKFQRLAADLAADRPAARIGDLLIELDERRALDIDEAEAQLEGDRVALMTIHASKGLEWEHVFVANVSPSSFPLQNNSLRDTVVLFDEARRALAFMYSADGRTPLRWLLATLQVDLSSGTVTKRDRDDSEEHRLFYVALTRARDTVYITGRLWGNRLKLSACLQQAFDWIAGRGHANADVALAADDNTNGSIALPLAETLDQSPVPFVERLEAQLSRELTPPTLPERRGRLSYTAIELHELCPRRARYHYVLGLPDLTDEAFAAVWSSESANYDVARRDPARFGRVVHLVLEKVANARISCEELDIERYLAEAMDDEDCFDDDRIRAAASSAVEAAVSLLSQFKPEFAERKFDITINGVELGGYIDLLARRDDGRLVVIDYKTGNTPSDHYKLQFSLYQEAAAAEFGERAEPLLLRVGEHTAVLEPIAPTDAGVLEQAVAAAQSMESEEPRPGKHCRTCPYAAGACDQAEVVLDGTAFSDSSVLR